MQNGFTATPCTFNGAHGYMLRQYVNGVCCVEQFIADLAAWCDAAGVPVKKITIIDQGG